MKRETMVILVIAVVAVAVAAAIFGYRLSGADDTLTENPNVIVPGQGTVCTMEAMLCPDGTYVGRVPPSCEFAACPGVSRGAAEAELNESVAVAGYTITPIEVVEDSRCPTDVQCIQAGTVRVRTQIGTDQNSPRYVFTLGVPQEINGTTFTLTAVSPNPISSRDIRNEEYRFTFTVSQ